jgi:hypothetical protein
LWIDRDAVPHPLAAADERFAQVLEYMRAITAEAELNAMYAPSGDRLVVAGAT